MGRSLVAHLLAREGDWYFCWTEDTGLPSQPQVQDKTHVDSQAPAGTGKAPGARTTISLTLLGSAGLQLRASVGGELGLEVRGLGSYHRSFLIQAVC